MGKKDRAEVENASREAEQRNLAARPALEDRIRDSRRAIMEAARAGTPEEVRHAQMQATMAALEIRAAALKEKVTRFTQGLEAREAETAVPRKARRKTRGKTLL